MRQRRVSCLKLDFGNKVQYYLKLNYLVIRIFSKSMKTSVIILTIQLAINILANASEWDGGAGNSDFNNPVNWSSDQAPNLTGFTFFGFFVPTGGQTADFNSIDQTANLTANLTTPQLNVFGGSNVIVNTGANELTTSDVFFSADLVNVNVRGNSSLEFSGNLRGSVNDLNLAVEAGSRLLLSGTLQNNQPIDFEGGGAIELSSASVTSGSGITVSGNTDLTLGGATNIQGNTQVGGGSALLGSGNISGNLNIDGVLSPGESGNGLISVNGDLTGSGAWLFDAVDSGNRASVSVSEQLDISQFTLSVSGQNSGSSGPIIIANYGSLTGGQFSDVTGLLPGQQIDYNFMGNQIAIVPEVSRILPVALAFIPVLFLRSRR